MIRLPTIGALAAVALASAPAAAQEELPAGEGYKLSEGAVLHTGAFARGGVISNVFYEDRDPISSGVLRLGGDVRVSSRSGDRLGEGASQRLTFDAGLGLEYQEYLSGNPNARAQRDVDIDAFGGLVAFPEGKLSLVLDDTLTRESRPANFETSAKLNRLVNEFETGADFRPGGGALTFGLRYRNITDLFENPDAPYADRMHHSGHLQSSWRLFPVTRLFFDGSIAYYDRLSDAVLQKNRATAYRAALGAATAITERTNATAHAGYQHMSYEAGESFSGVIGGAKLTHRYSPFGKANLGYDREVRDSINANYYADHRIYAGADQQIRRFLAGARGEVRFRRYGGVPDIVGGTQTSRDDLILATDLNLQYMVRDGMSASLSYNIARVETDFDSVFEGDDPSYVRHAVFAGFRAAF